ncbi:MAG: putative quinol monooxygenase [Pseudomonadota bacterium]
MFAVVVTIEVKPGAMPDFLPAMIENACASREEPACQRFDVWTERERPYEVFLYEVYDDEAGFAAHKATAHYKVFDARVTPLIASKEVRTYGRAFI